MRSLRTSLTEGGMKKRSRKEESSSHSSSAAAASGWLNECPPQVEWRSSRILELDTSVRVQMARFRVMESGVNMD
jgi:hypothetical protein